MDVCSHKPLYYIDAAVAVVKGVEHISHTYLHIPGASHGASRSCVESLWRKGALEDEVIDIFNEAKVLVNRLPLKKTNIQATHKKQEDNNSGSVEPEVCKGSHLLAVKT